MSASATPSAAALGLIEVHSWTASIAVLDRMEKAAHVRLLQIEINDLYGACIKVAGPVSDLAAALDAGRALAESMAASCVVDLISNPDARAQAAWMPPASSVPSSKRTLFISPATLTRSFSCPTQPPSPSDSSKPRV